MTFQTATRRPVKFSNSDLESPIVVVLSGSMEPAFYRGDLLFLYHDREVFWNRKIGLLIWITNQAPIDAGEIVVFKIEGRDIPIVHRVIKRHENTETGEVKILTKVSSLILEIYFLKFGFRNLDF